MKEIFRISIISILVFLLTGCVFTTEPYRQTKHHDLGIPELKNPDGPKTAILNFRNNGPYLYRMVFRTKNNELKIDEYNKWAQVPEKMLTRYLKMGFTGNGKPEENASFSVSGAVLAFEGDMLSENAILTVECFIKENNGKQRKVSFSETYLEKMKNPEPSELAPAMSANAAKFANRIKEEINKMK